MKLFRYYLSFFIIFLLTISIGSTSGSFSSNNAIPLSELNQNWTSLFWGFIISSSILSYITFIFKGINIKLTKILIFFSDILIGFTTKILNIKIGRKYKLRQLIVDIGISYLILLAIGSIIHYYSIIDRGLMIGIYNRYYIEPKRLITFLASAIAAFHTLLGKDKIRSRVSILGLILATLTQALVDQSRYFVFPLLFLITGLLFKEKIQLNTLYVKFRSLKLNKRFIKSSFIPFATLIAALSFMYARLKPLVLLSYLSSYSYYALGTTNFSTDDFTYYNFFISLSGIPVTFFKLIGIDYSFFRLSRYAPVTGMLQLYSLNNSFFWGGVLFAFLLLIPFILLSNINNTPIKIISFLFCIATIITMLQYDIRFSLRLLQLSMLTSILSLPKKKSYYSPT